MNQRTENGELRTRATTTIADHDFWLCESSEAALRFSLKGTCEAGVTNELTHTGNRDSQHVVKD